MRLESGAAMPTFYTIGKRKSKKESLPRSKNGILYFKRWIYSEILKEYRTAEILTFRTIMKKDFFETKKDSCTSFKLGIKKF